MQKHTPIIAIVILIILLGGAAVGAFFYAPSKHWAQDHWKSATQHHDNSQRADSTKHLPFERQTFTTYAALGDSVAAGAGLPHIPNANSVDIACARSSQAYPELVAKRLQTKLIFAACGGATSSHLITAQHLGDVSNPPQLDLAFKSAQPDLFTITLGANDMEWIQMLMGCFSDNCATQQHTDTIDAALSDFKMKLYYDLHDIETRSKGTQPRIILTGYYQLGTQACLSSLVPEKITPAEVSWLSTQTTKMNNVIKSVAQEYPNTSYVSIDTAKHGLCASDKDRWVQELADPAPFHLTTQGEKAMADAIYAKLQS